MAQDKNGRLDKWLTPFDANKAAAPRKPPPPRKAPPPRKRPRGGGAGTTESRYPVALVSILSSSDDEGNDAQSRPASKPVALESRKVVRDRRKKAATRSTPLADNNSVIVDSLSRLGLCDVADLAVHKAKVDQLRVWLQGHGHGGVLLLTGPTGSGKSTTIFALCRQLQMEIVEWTNETQFHVSESARDDHTGRIYEDSQVDLFTRFLRSADYAPLTQPNTRRLILVEHLPNAFYCDVQLLHNCLATHIRILRSPLIIVLSNVDSSWMLNPARIFPPRIVRALDIDEIAFNPCASTFIHKALKRVATAMRLPCTAMELKQIAEAANGDIRSAMYNLDLCRSGNGEGLALRECFCTSSRADHLEFFHLLARILYAKRDLSNECMQDAVLRRSACARPPTISDPNAIVDSCQVSGVKLSEFLYENEPDFVAHINALSRFFIDLSLFDSIASDWRVAQNGIVDEYRLQIVVRSAIFHNFPSITAEPGRSSRGLHKMRKPKIPCRNEMQGFARSESDPRLGEVENRRNTTMTNAAMTASSIATAFHAYATFEAKSNVDRILPCAGLAIDDRGLTQSSVESFQIEESDDDW